VKLQKDKMMKRYLPIDLPGLFYMKFNQRLNKKEYSRLCRELSKKDRYSVVKATEALALYDQDQLHIPDAVRVIWVHDIESPSDNWLAEEIAKMEADYGLSSTHNIRTFCIMNDEMIEPLKAVVGYGGEIGYQYEDLVATKGDARAARILFGKNLEQIRTHFPDVTTAFAHGVWLSGVNAIDQFKTNGRWKPAFWQKYGIHKNGEFYYFMDLLKAKYQDKFRYIIEDSCMGADEFLAALRAVPPGGVALFLQHPIYWSTVADVESWKKLREML
jgi:hypothetical protein